MKYVTMFWDWVDTRLVIRRIMTLGTFVMTAWVIWWSMTFAFASTRPGGEVAMIISAIMVPLNWLMAYLFASYSKGREA